MIQVRVNLESAEGQSPKKGSLTKTLILDAALDIANKSGLEGITIGALADKVNMSKSGVFAHFGSREELQVEVVRAYHRSFQELVFQLLITPFYRRYLAQYHLNRLDIVGGVFLGPRSLGALWVVLRSFI